MKVQKEHARFTLLVTVILYIYVLHHFTATLFYCFIALPQNGQFGRLCYVIMALAMLVVYAILYKPGGRRGRVGKVADFQPS